MLLAGCGLTDPDSAINERAVISPTAVFGGRTYTAVSAGFVHSCAIETGGLAWCWGANHYGQLGRPTTENCGDVPVCARRPVEVSGGRRFVRIAAGVTHSCALTSAGAAWCWGGGYESESAGYLGNGVVSRSNVPVAVTADSAFVEIAVGAGNSCALTASGQAWCWGANMRGEVGDGTQLPKLEPVPVATSSRYVSITLGDEHTCALTVAGAADCWGHNRWGQLGTGAVPYNNIGAYQATPVRVVSDAPFAQIAAGGAHSCAVRTDGQLACWGINEPVGQLGDGSGVTHRGAPGLVAGGLRYTAVHAGTVTTCARTTDGAAQCWGSNYFGALGNGTRSDTGSPVPVTIPGLDVAALSAGGSHACGLRPNGALLCWGDRQYGQVGN